MLLSSHTLKLRNLYGIKQKKTNKITFRKYNTFHNSKDKKREEELNKIFEETFFRKVFKYTIYNIYMLYCLLFY